MNYLLRAWQFFRPDLPRVWFAFGLLSLTTGTGLLKPWPLAVIVDGVLNGRSLPGWLDWAAPWPKPALLGLLGATLVFLHTGQGALSAWQNYVSIKIGLRGLARVRNQLFSWLLRRSLRSHLASDQGDLIYRASWDVYAFQTLFQQGLFTFVQASLALILMLVVMWRLNGTLTLVALATMPLLLLTMTFFGRAMKRRSLASHQADSLVTSQVQQAIAALPLIQSYTREAEEEKRFAAHADQALTARTSQHGWEVFYWLVIALVFGLATGGITWLGASEVLAGRLTMGEWLVFLAYLAQLYEPLNQLSQVGATISDASAGIHRVFELLDSQDDVAEMPSARPIPSGAAPNHPLENLTIPLSPSPAPLFTRGAIRFDKVSFGYRSDRLILHDLSFSLAPGETVAIVGPSGAGKTTLLQLLPRFYDPTAGSVCLDGIDLRELRLKDLRGQIALVFQEPVLLTATIAENIAYGRPDASLSAIEAAARAAHADDFIRKLPKQFETLVGEGAARLSVGEKQRLNLARAFLKDAPVLVLDEPTSSLDADNEAFVVDSLHALMRQRTTLLVAHRFSTIRRVDRILVIENGHLTESGTHEELLEHGGYYATMAKTQWL
jgi:ATP-binding cassette subfamily B protein